MGRPEIAMLSEFIMSDLTHRNTDSLCAIDVTKNLSFFFRSLYIADYLLYITKL